MASTKLSELRKTAECGKRGKLCCSVGSSKAKKLTSPPDPPPPGALPLDPAGGSAPRPPDRLALRALAIGPPGIPYFPAGCRGARIDTEYKYVTVRYAYSNKHTNNRMKINQQRLSNFLETHYGKNSFPRC